MKNHPALVFDIGSSTIRCGHATSTAGHPRFKIPTVVAYPRNDEQQAASASAGGGPTTITVFCGDDAMKMKAVSDLRRPIHDGHISSAQDVRQLLGHASDLNGSGRVGETPIVIAEPLFAPKSYREEVASYFFEELGAPSVLFCSSGLTALFAVGELSGVVLDIGKSSTRAISAVDGIGLPSTFSNSSTSGDSVSQALETLLRREVSDSNNAIDFSDKIKENVCVCAEDTDALQAVVEQSSSSAPTSFELPDKSIVKINQAQRALPSEVLWNDSSMSQLQREPLSVTQVVEECLLATDDILRPHLMPRLHPVGATVALPNFEQRLLFELRRPRQHVREISLAARSLFAVPPSSSSIKKKGVCDPGDRTWAGAAIFASLSSAQMLFTTREEYEEHGAPTLARNRQLAA